MLTAESTCPIFHLPDICPKASTTHVSAPTLAGVEVSVLQSPLLANGGEQHMDVSYSSVGDSCSQGDVGQFSLPFTPQDCPDLQSYKYLLKLILDDLGKSDLVREVPKP